MRKLNLLCTCLLSLSINGYSQIIAPDTIITGVNTSFTSDNTGVSYTWSFENTDLTPNTPPTESTIVNGGLLSSPSFSCTVNDNDNWYTFLTNYFSGDIIRMNHGTAPTNTPTTVNLGNYGMNYGQSGGIDIVKDEISGNWFGFVVNGTQLLRLSFGNALSNSPTTSLMSFPNALAWPHEFKIKKFGSKWIGFVANRSYGISKFDFGTSLTNTPTPTVLPITDMQSPVSFSIINEDNSWHMFVTNLVPGSISRFDFGTDINNNNPTSVSLGNFGLLSLTRKIVMVRNCNQLFAYVNDEYNRLYKLDFHDDAIKTTPTLTPLTNINYNNFELIAYKNEIRAMIIKSNYNEFATAPFIVLDANKTFTNYYQQQQSYTFTSPGVYDINLTIDQGKLIGNQTYCKQVVVMNSKPTSIANVSNQKNAIVLFPNPAKNDLNLSIPENDYYSLMVANTLGQVIVRIPATYMTTDQPFHIDLNKYKLPVGIYTLSLTNNSGGQYNAKFIKSN